MSEERQRIVVGMTGGSGAALAVRLLEGLATAVPGRERREVHLVASTAGATVLKHETGRELESLRPWVEHIHDNTDMMAPIASGSYRVQSMVIVPCSMRTLSAVATGNSDGLILRAADVCLKERRRLVLVAREAPLGLVHIDNMRKATEAGAMILPPMVTLYTHPKTVAEVVDQIVGRILDAMGIDNTLLKRWS